MNIKRLILAIVVAFIVLWVTDFLIHGIWMMPDYRATQSLWRPDADMKSHMGWMLGAQLLFADYLCPPFLDPLGRDRASWLRHWIRFAHGPVFGSLGHHYVCRHSHALLDRL